MRPKPWLNICCTALLAAGPARGQSQTPQSQGAPRLTEIQLPKEQPRKDVLDALSKSEQENITKSAVPVLLLPNIREFEKRHVVVQEVYYSAFFADGKQFISVQGSHLAYTYPQAKNEPNAGKTRIRSTDGFLTESERIWTASWKEFGAAYLLSLECADENDKRCQSPEYASHVTNSLVYVGGGRARIGSQVPTVREQQPKGSDDFSYNPPGQLLPGSGTGRQDDTVYAPGIRFPIESKPDYANSQVWNPGGSNGPPGSQCDPKNYSYPWWDNFCETRQYPTPMCPVGNGHQGQDVRPSTCEKDKHATVSATDGTVTHIGAYTVFITAPDGTQYRYLHMSSLLVKVGDKVTKGERIGRVSNVFGSTSTTIHLHFEIVQNVADLGFTHVPPYMSLVKAYENLP